MSLPYFCLCKLAWTSVTNMPGRPYRIHWRKLALGADKMSNPLPSSIVVVCTLQLPAIFLWDEKLVAPLIATPNVDKCKRRQKEKATKLGYMLHIIPMQNKYYSICNNLDKVLIEITLWVEKWGLRWAWKKREAFWLPPYWYLNSCSTG